MVARICLFLAVGLLTSNAWAQASDPIADAKKAFEEANILFDGEEYEAALPLYQKAYELSNRRPSTIRALAQCERALRMYDEAIRHFREYLGTRPDDATRIVETLEILEELRDASRSATPAPPPSEPPPPVVEPPPPEPPDAPGGPSLTTTEPPPVEEEGGGLLASPWFWGAVAVVVVGGGVGLGVALSGTEETYGGTADFIFSR